MALVPSANYVILWLLLMICFLALKSTTPSIFALQSLGPLISSNLSEFKTTTFTFYPLYDTIMQPLEYYQCPLNNTFVYSLSVNFDQSRHFLVVDIKS